MIFNQLENMANSKSIGIIAGIAVAVIIGIALAASFEGADSPLITQDKIVIEEEQIVEKGTVQTTSQGDTISIEESVEITKDETEFFINENGTKTYVIDVGDTPSIADG